MNTPRQRPTLLRFARTVWQHRRELDTPAVRPEEAEFLPGTLALEASPPSPTATWCARLILALLGLGAAWATFGEVDIVAQAPAVVVTAQRNQVLASPVTTQVRAVHVTEGSRVRAGEVLLELDDTAATHEQDDAREVIVQARRDMAAGEALLRALRAPSGGRGPDEPDWPAELDDEGRARVQALWADYRARIARVHAELVPVRRALQTAADEADDLRRLYADQLVSRQAWTDREQHRTELEGRAAALAAQAVQHAAEFRHSSQEMTERGRATLARARLTEAKSRTQRSAHLLRAPVDGTVHRLAAHTVGGVVAAAQPLLEIVPHGAPIELEATVANRDIAHIHVGQAVAVKVDAYESGRHGVLPGRVAYVSPDAVREERSGDVRPVGFRVRVAIDGATLPFAVSPGMTARADIRTGSRTLAEYLLSPILRHVRDSLTER